MNKKLSSADLNLLPVLQVLLEERSVTRAAGRLNLTQPAISRNLARLRTLFNDPLFTRTPKGLIPTPRAEQLAGKLQQSLRDIEGLIQPELFVPAKAERLFTITTTDYGSQALLPNVITRLRSEAPGIDLEIHPWEEHYIHQLDENNVDLALCAVSNPPAQIHGRGIGQDRFVCVVSPEHPLANGAMSLEDYARWPHALITMGGEKKGAIDHMLERYNLERRIALRVPHFVAALALIRESDLILTIPYALASSCAAQYNLKILALPLEQEPFTYSIVWHERYQRDEGHIWFRQLMYEELTARLRVIQQQCALLTDYPEPALP
ncbi:LysR family transcriptional regulator [Parendozoicomonas haliclonae]|uniref:Nodulation protein D 2 n=1 Tax=Parendozoicomonas haliclonae TaxID=1960125 RepID=A0A1X7AQI5_9GAMM|nr:LysR family transcriptional regulator [Parendozoicomonas haliclonae]SMA50358.1 Nodulation protein D 2 [Parendozoicomonas haliclonae]